ncbi:FKBP-type peptidyl-prolyl cis-trans isomerase [Pedobacter gandavensis]|uniref:FKBP-type peptidyl-prolyl cis-trans isomerase n=1 Tax=Pedobacter gandavensis TaxID=2679963 RepID=UPI00292FE3D6|nr:FKBP-type peptidyl-prolyl cis-trans isomerase [Pedobacter gandavensis]
MIKKLSLYTFALLATIVIFSSCKKDYTTVQMMDENILTDFFKKNNINAIPDSAKTGYYYVLNQPVAVPGDPVAEVYKLSDSVRYSITLTGFSNGIVYLSTPALRNEGQRVGTTFGFYGKGIPAISQVLNKLKPGGSTKIYLPSYLAFGKNGFPTANIPSNEIMVISITTYKESQKELDDVHLKAYIAANSFTDVIKDASGIYYQILAPATGTDPITLISLVNFSYNLKTLDGGVTQDATTTFAPKDLIPAFRIMMPKFKKGNKVRMFLPSVLSYGNRAQDGTNSFPANSCLDYTVEILAVTP